MPRHHNNDEFNWAALSHLDEVGSTAHMTCLGYDIFTLKCAFHDSVIVVDW